MDWKTNSTGIEFALGNLLYSVAARLRAGYTVPFSGVVPDEIDANFAGQVRDVLRLVGERIAAAGLTPNHVWKFTVSLFVPGLDPDTYDKMYDAFNTLYRAWLTEQGFELPPVRFCSAAAWLPRQSMIEIVPEAFVTIR